MKSLLLFTGMILTALLARAQHSVQLLVRSLETRAPVTAATIKDPKTGTITRTDEKGQARLTLGGASVTLEISSVGFEPLTLQVTSRQSSPVIVELTPSNYRLSEVTVSTGYQTLPKERSTGSFSRVDEKLFNQQVGTDILSRLPSIANGLTSNRGTGTGDKLLIRGLSTITGPTDPLIVLDNFPYDGNLTNINPNDVESVTVLKDAAAASIWGARAANGVIVITTKKGRFQSPVSIEFNTNLTAGNKPDLGYLRPISSSDFIDVEKRLFAAGYYNSQLNNINRSPLTPVVDLLRRQQAGQLTAADANSQINALRGHDVRDDFSRYFYRGSFNQQYALNLRGGSDRFSWITSGGYDRNIGNLSESYQRINLRFQQTFRPIKALQISAGAYLTQTRTGNGRPGYGDITSTGSSLYPYASFADDADNALPVVKGYSSAYKATAGNGKLLDWQYYPLTDDLSTDVSNNSTDILANAGINAAIFKGLSADVKYQYERQSTGGRTLNGADSYFVRDLVNRFTQIDAAGNVTYKVPKGSVLDLSNGLLESHNVRGQLSFDREVAAGRLTAIAGAEVRSAHTLGNNYRTYGYNEDLLTSGNVDYLTRFPNFVNGNTELIPDVRGFGDATTRYISYYGNAAYTYQNKYTVSVSGRRDASNLFGLNTNDQWNPFWSTGGGWVISREKFYQSKLVPYLKLRGTYGFSGNINPAMVARTTLQYATSLNPLNQQPFAQFSNYANPELRWETSKMLNLGMDVRLAGDHLSGSVEYYRKNGSGLFGAAQIDYTSGIGSQIIKNVAEMQGNGVDVELHGNLSFGPLNWSSLLNMSFYKEMVTRYNLTDNRGSSFISATGSFSVTGLVGYPVYSLLAYRWAGLDPQTGEPLGYLNGQPSKNYAAIVSTGTTVNDLKYFGSAVPTKYGSWINSFGWHRLELAVNLVYKLGYYFRRRSINYNRLATENTGHADYALRWQKPGDELMTQVPAFLYPLNVSRDAVYEGSELLVEKGDHIRLQYINLSYDLPLGSKNATASRHSLKIYGTVQNVGLLWRANKQGIDPDYSFGANRVPAPRTYSIGLRTTF